MKTVLPTLIFILYSWFCVSQITITSQQSIQPHDSIYFSKLDTTGFSPGNSGANVLWDFSNINVLQYNAYEYFYLPTNYSACIGITDTVNMYLDFHAPAPDYYYSYYYADSTQLIYKGYCDHSFPWGGNQNYTDPPVSLIFPFNFLDSFTDSSIGVLQHPGYFWQTNGTATRVYDSYGELRLPWITLPNTARVYSYSYNVDSITYATSLGGDSLTVTTGFSYSWYDLNSHGPVLIYSEVTNAHIRLTGTRDTTFSKFLGAYTNSILGINDKSTSKTTFKIFPNPSKGILNIEIPDQFKNESQLELTIYDVLGKIIFTNQLSSISKVSKIDLPIKKKGLYLVSLSNQKQIITSKLSIE